ncbi:MAG: DUF5697 family protein [Bacteroidales bacterium]|nr:DUF5697 family protein [Bacteroidales bacterium]
MVKFIEQKEIGELDSILRTCGIITVEFARALLKKRDKSDEQIETILNQLVKRKIGFYDEAKVYLRANKAMKPQDMRKGVMKALWLMLDLSYQIQDYYIQPPASVEIMTFMLNDVRDNPFYDVFYIPYTSEQLSVFQINEFAKQRGNDVNLLVIIDNEDQIKTIKQLRPQANIKYFVIIDANGNAKYFEKKEGNNA